MSRKSIQIVVVIIVVGLIAFAGFSLYGGRQSAAIDVSQVVVPTEKIVVDHAASQAVKVHRAVSQGRWPLPPKDAPLASNYEALKAHADAGDASASCRLAFELNRCAQLPELRELSENYITQAAASRQGTTKSQADTDVAVRLESSLRSAESVCEGFRPNPSDKAWKYLLRAAKAGHVPSMVRYAVQPPLSEQRFAEDAEGWAQYRKEAGPLLTRAAESGNSAAAYHLFMAYYGVPMPGGAEIVKPNKMDALSYAIVVQHLADSRSLRSIERAINKLENTLPLNDQRKAQELARKLLDSSFVGAAGEQDFVSNPIIDDPQECASF